MTSIETLASGPTQGAAARVEIVVPVFNEEHSLETGIHRLRRYLDSTFPFSCLITIADNASTDRTQAVAARLAEEVPGVRSIRLADKGRGRALRATWPSSASPVVAYMDVDLSTDLDALLPLVAPLLSGHSDLSIGTRLAPGAHVVRGAKRECLSRAYNAIVHATLGGQFTDAQCGFKAMRSDAAHALVPLVEDDGWFFDTELLVLAQRSGLRIHEVPVDWVDDPDSRVEIAATVREDLRGIWRLLRTSPADPGVDIGARRCRGADSPAIARVAGVGLASTLAYLAVFIVLRPRFGPYWANALAIGVTALTNAAVHARMSSSPASRQDRLHLQAVALLAAAASLAFTTAALAVVGSVAGWSAGTEIAAVILGTALAAPIRFVTVHRSAMRDLRTSNRHRSGKDDR